MSEQEKSPVGLGVEFWATYDEESFRVALTRNSKDGAVDRQRKHIKFFEDAGGAQRARIFAEDFERMREWSQELVWNALTDAKLYKEVVKVVKATCKPMEG